jgi:hypothetical protein
MSGAHVRRMVVPAPAQASSLASQPATRAHPSNDATSS